MIKRCISSLITFYQLFLFLTVNATEAERKSFIEELNIMKSISPHENIISPLGCVTKSGNSFFLQC